MNILQLKMSPLRCLSAVQILLLLCSAALAREDTILQDDLDEVSNLYTIEGKVYLPDVLMSGGGGGGMGGGYNVPPSSIYSASKYPRGEQEENRLSPWETDMHVIINRGEYKGFLRPDGSFIISGIPSGSYVVELISADYYYEPVRVEINPKGKFRARKVNFVQPSQVIQVPYPLKMKPITKYKYFQMREQWKITDFLFSPMVLMMILPLLLLLILPRMINDPETKKDLENMQFPKMNSDMPEISEMFTSLFTGKSKPMTTTAATATSTSNTEKKFQSTNHQVNNKPGKKRN